MDDIKTLETKCEQIKEKSEMKQEERRKIMSDTKMLLKTKGEILTNIDKRKYQLLIEKESVGFFASRTCPQEPTSDTRAKSDML